ncbi:MAG: hypothetical protein RBT54_03075 [Thauera sp.]|jgi:hypothetical protein|nr:hypothetical protein [Thauera sp.]
MPLTTRVRLALLSLALPAALLASPAQAETLSCPALNAAVQVAPCPNEAELQYTFMGFCGDNARLYGRDAVTCSSFENYKAVKNTALWESANGDFSGYLNCNLETDLLRASKALKMSAEKKNNLTRLICDYENEQRMVMRTRATCTVEAADCASGECRATCD